MTGSNTSFLNSLSEEEVSFATLAPIRHRQDQNIACIRRQDPPRVNSVKRLPLSIS